MISRVNGGAVIRVDIVRSPETMAEEPSERLLSSELEDLERAMDSEDLEGAWDMFKSAAKKVVAGGKKVIAKAKEKIQNASVRPPASPAHSVYTHEGKIEMEFPPEFYQEMEKFFKLFEMFFQASENMWQKQQEQAAPEPGEGPAGDEEAPGTTTTSAQAQPVVYYVLRSPAD